ncbi:MAG TPA: globin [Caulobacteraceae bacterium]|nr:globin [Caulobacteraceae bacterium]
MDADAIIRTLEIAAERAGDLSPLVYARLFAAHPGMESQFARDTDGSIRGEMLSRVFETILDFVGDRAYAARMIQCEVVTHDGYGVPPAVFGRFFEVVAETLRAVLAEAWTPEVAAAWRELLSELDWFATHPDQHATAA